MRGWRQAWMLGGAAAAAAALVLSAGVHAQSLDRRSAESDPPSLRDLRALDVTDMQGTRWTADRLRGRVTLIDVWATWCAPCLTELPYLKRARARHSRDDFEVLGVSIDVSDRRTFVSWASRHGVAWPQIFDGRGRSGPAARQLQVVGVPTSFLVDRHGRVLAMNLRGERLLAAIDALVRRRT